MPATWDDAELGTFEFNGEGWWKVVEAPGFDVFAYKRSYVQSKRPDGRYELLFYADDGRDTPSDEAVGMARRLVADSAGMAAKVIAAVRDDFTGRGPGSGSCWQGELERVAEALEYEEVPPPAGAEDIGRLLRLSEILVHKAEQRLDEAVIELSFQAAFEVEHGVGVLTDGERVLGLGYVLEAEPFEEKGPSEK